LLTVHFAFIQQEKFTHSAVEANRTRRTSPSSIAAAGTHIAITIYITSSARICTTTNPISSTFYSIDIIAIGSLALTSISTYVSYEE
jgi:hypothetical protein